MKYLLLLCLSGCASNSMLINDHALNRPSKDVKIAVNLPSESFQPIRYGDRGERVKELQKLLNKPENGSCGIRTFGNFLSKTNNCVLGFQYERGISEIDVGPITWGALKQ